MVELCRFLACYVIFSYHAGGRFTTGWIFVEFFFMLSGYFAIKHLVRIEGKIENKATYPIQYTIDKFKRLLPYTTVGFVADCLISAWKYQFTGMELVKWILYLPVNLFYLAGTGMMRRMFLFPTRYRLLISWVVLCGISVRCLWQCQ